MNRIYVTVVVCMVLLAGCAKKASEEIDFGVVEGSAYRNNYFNMKVNIPSEWSIQDREAQKNIMDTGLKTVLGDDKNLKALTKASELQTVNLFAAFKYPIGSPVEFNPNIICLAEQVRQLPGIKRGKDYHFHSKKLLQSSQMEVSFPEDIYTGQIDGVDFDIMPLQITYAGRIIKQKHYAAIMKGYALLLSLSFTNDTEEAELNEILKSITFK
jgi:hypothetical protein